ncbi:MAG: NUDIX domain-containing protein [Candidatus Nanopelagicaceae bacterium]|nr:NUDIX domain-containing protein [Candidatus Nanopelagicaceae bacterium]
MKGPDDEPPFLRDIDQRAFETNQWMGKSGIALVTNELGEILLHLRDDKPEIPHPNQWGFLGGGCEDGEDPAQAVLRELFEEAELIVETAEPLCRIVDIEGSRGLATVFRVVTEVRLADMRLHEGQEIRFFSQEQTRALALDPLIREILNQFFKPI